MPVLIDHVTNRSKPSMETHVSGVQKEKPDLTAGDILKYGGELLYAVSAAYPAHQGQNHQTKRSLSCRYLPLRRKSEAQNAYTSGLMPIDAAIGLPPAIFRHTEQGAFVRYFKPQRNPSTSPTVTAVQHPDPRCSAIPAAMRLGELWQTVPRALILDVGGFTATYLMLKNGHPTCLPVTRWKNGVILLYNRIRSKASAPDLDVLLEETDVDYSLCRAGRQLRGRSRRAGGNIRRREFVNDMLGALRERQLDLRTGRVIFVGGGARLLRRQIETSGKVAAPCLCGGRECQCQGL